MTLFDSVLVLTLVAILLLRISHRFAVPYPTMLAIAGVLMAASPWVPDVHIDPSFVLALFIAPALLDAAYNFPPSALRRYWLPLSVLAGGAVLVTTAAVAGFAVVWAGMPWAAAIALGAIVSPPDEAAATAMIARLNLPRATLAILTGESLLNDTVALFLYSTAVGFATSGNDETLFISHVAIALPGALVIGLVLGVAYLYLAKHLFGTLSGVLFGFVTTFGTWEVADRLDLSPTMAVIALAMTVARYSSERQGAHDRVYANSVWQLIVFVLNAVAFLLVGLETREIVRALTQADMLHASAFALGVFVIIVVARFFCVGLYYRFVLRVSRRPEQRASARAQSVVIAWCGMRGLVTLATALALPASFPARNLIVLSALAAVLGSLILQGLTLGPLIRLMRFAHDESFDQEIRLARIALLKSAIESLSSATDEGALLLRKTYEVDETLAESGSCNASRGRLAALRSQAVREQREKLQDLRHSALIEDDVFRALERELDMAELGVSPSAQIEAA